MLDHLTSILETMSLDWEENHIWTNQVGCGIENQNNTLPRRFRQALDSQGTSFFLMAARACQALDHSKSIIAHTASSTFSGKCCNNPRSHSQLIITLQDI